jgi:hypothetical protein
MSAELATLKKERDERMAKVKNLEMLHKTHHVKGRKQDESGPLAFSVSTIIPFLSANH